MRGRPCLKWGGHGRQSILEYGPQVQTYLNKTGDTPTPVEDTHTQLKAVPSRNIRMRPVKRTSFRYFQHL